MEEEFKIEFPDDVAEKFKDINDMVEFVSRSYWAAWIYEKLSFVKWANCPSAELKSVIIYFVFNEITRSSIASLKLHFSNISYIVSLNYSLATIMSKSSLLFKR